jgi:hypothetical protein
VAALGALTQIGVSVACCGLLFFLFCIGLVLWYLVRQPKQQVSAEAPAPVIQATIEHPTAAGTAPAPASQPVPETAPQASEQPVADSPATPEDTPASHE